MQEDVDELLVRERVRVALQAMFEVRLPPEHDGEPLRDVPELDYDSATVMECVTLMEEEFGIEIDDVDDDLRVTFRSIASIAGLVVLKLVDRTALERLSREPCPPWN